MILHDRSAASFSYHSLSSACYILAVNDLLFKKRNHIPFLNIYIILYASPVSDV